MAYNKVILIGRLVADPELLQSANGVSVCKIRLAVNRPSQKGSEAKTDFINVVAFRKTAEFVSKYFAKGGEILIEGSLQNNEYVNQNGEKKQSYVVVADSVHFCGGVKAKENVVAQTTPVNGANADNVPF